MAILTSNLWSDLPMDLVNSIVPYLTCEDYCHFRAVCKNWNMADPPNSNPFTLKHSLLCSPTKCLLKSPNLLHMGRDGSLINSFSTFFNQTFLSKIPEIEHARIRFAGYGWLLMSQSDPSLAYCAMFFFNPFTKERIDLPNFELRLHFQGISFSSSPTSPDCIVFAIEICGIWDRITYIRRGESSWTSFIVDKGKDVRFTSSFCNPIFHEGLFYFMGKEGNFGIYNPDKDGDEVWQISQLPEKPCASVKTCYLAECNGSLVSVFLGRMGEWVRVYFLDSKSNVWKRKRNLDGQALFLSRVASLSTSSSQKVLKSQGMKNNIYFPMFKGREIIFYSMETAMFETSAGYSAPNYYNVQQCQECVWIEPNFEMHTIEELKWF